MRALRGPLQVPVHLHGLFCQSEEEELSFNGGWASGRLGTSVASAFVLVARRQLRQVTSPYYLGSRITQRSLSTTP